MLFSVLVISVNFS